MAAKKKADATIGEGVLQEKLSDAEKTISEQALTIEALKKETEELIFQISESSEGANRDIKTEMLLAMLPQVRIDYAHADAQKAEKAVDEIMKVWGLNS